ncbi:MAG: hypothetical protein ACOZCL_07855 [Bacillota bacterium]
MRLFRRRRVIGILIFSIGAGILLAIIVPTVGWIIFSAICLVCLGIYLLRC